jgi:hypothetical protein
MNVSKGMHLCVSRHRNNEVSAFDPMAYSAERGRLDNLSCIQHVPCTISVSQFEVRSVRDVLDT